jgi:Kelch motif
MCALQFTTLRRIGIAPRSRFSRLCSVVMTLATMIWAAPGFAGGFTGAAPLATARYFHTASLLPSGKVLVIGGVLFNSGGSQKLASAELYDPVSDTWIPAASMSFARARHSVTSCPRANCW